MPKGLYNGKTSFNFEFVMTYIPGTRVQKNSDKLCGVFNTDRCQFNSRSFHTRKLTPFKIRYDLNYEYHKGT